MQWFKVEFDLGVGVREDIPTDPADFIKWLATEPESLRFIHGLSLISQTRYSVLNAETPT